MRAYIPGCRRVASLKPRRRWTPRCPNASLEGIVRGAATLNDNERALDLKVGECCTSALPVLVFDPAGNLVRSWGGPGKGYEWPGSYHGLHVDYKGNVWIGGNGMKDAQVLKFTKDGRFLMQVGHYGKGNGSNDLENFGRAAKIWVDPKTNEAYVADGYRNKRVAVLDADSGKLKRYWGAYGNKPDDTDLGKYDPKAPPAKQFCNPLALRGAHARRPGVRLRPPERPPSGVPARRPFVKEAFVAKETLGSGSTWDIAFSKDAEQRYIFMADGTNEKVRIIDRASLTEIANFGDGGRQPEQFFGVHSIAADSKGNLYTTETYEGKESACRNSSTTASAR